MVYELSRCYSSRSRGSNPRSIRKPIATKSLVLGSSQSIKNDSIEPGLFALFPGGTLRERIDKTRDRISFDLFSNLKSQQLKIGTMDL
jgi:hypothetical protein